MTSLTATGRLVGDGHAPAPSHRRRSVLPGFGFSLGFSLVYLGLIVLIPLAGVFVRAAGLDLSQILGALASPRLQSALKLSFGTAFLAASINALFGALVAWVFVRYRFPGKRLLDAVVDLPFALPTESPASR